MGIPEKLVENLIRRTVKEEIDRALAVSEKRRKDFKAGFSKVFTEADATQPPAGQPPADPTAAQPATPPADPSAAGTPAAPAGGDPNAPATGADPTDPTATPGAPGGAPGDPNAPVDGDPEAEGENPGVNGGGGGFGGFGGGGGGGGGGGDFGEGGEETPEAPEEPEAEEPTGDPIVAMVSGAQELLNQTQDPNLILKSLKGQIQTLFREPEHALGLVKALYDTQDSILQSVAQRLYLFIKTSRPQ